MLNERRELRISSLCTMVLFEPQVKEQPTLLLPILEAVHRVLRRLSLGSTEEAFQVREHLLGYFCECTFGE